MATARSPYPATNAYSKKIPEQQCCSGTGMFFSRYHPDYGFNKPPLNYPYNGGHPDTPSKMFPFQATCGFPPHDSSAEGGRPKGDGVAGFTHITSFQNIGSGVYLHIFRHLLTPTAVSLNALTGIPSEDIFLSVMAFLIYKIYFTSNKKKTQ